jgi:hypothetical protein
MSVEQETVPWASGRLILFGWVSERRWRICRLRGALLVIGPSPPSLLSTRHVTSARYKSALAQRFRRPRWDTAQTPYNERHPRARRFLERKLLAHKLLTAALGTQPFPTSSTSRRARARAPMRPSSQDSIPHRQNQSHAGSPAIRFLRSY